MNAHIVKRYDARLQPGQCIVLRGGREGDDWIEHGAPIDIASRLGNGMVVDSYVVGASVLSKDVAVLYRGDHTQVGVLHVTAQNKNRIYELCMQNKEDFA